MQESGAAAPPSALELIERQQCAVVWIDGRLAVRYANAAARSLLRWVDGCRPESDVPALRRAGSTEPACAGDEAAALRRFLGAPHAAPSRRRVALWGRTLDLRVQNMQGARGEWLGWLVEAEPAAADAPNTFNELPLNALLIDERGRVAGATSRFFAWWRSLGEWMPAAESTVVGSAFLQLLAPSRRDAQTISKFGPHAVRWNLTALEAGHPWNAAHVATASPINGVERNDAAEAEAEAEELMRRAWGLVREMEHLPADEPTLAAAR